MQPKCEIFYASNQIGGGKPEDLNGDFFIIDVAKHDVHLISDHSPCSTEVVYDFSSEKLWSEGCNGDPFLYDLDLHNGDVVSSVQHDFGALTGMEFVDGVLYGTFLWSSNVPSFLVTVDLDTGAFLFLGLTGFGPISGLAYDGHVMWGVTAGSEDAVLVTIDLESGEATKVAPLVDEHHNPVNKMGSIEFGPDGTLYGGFTDIGTFPNYIVSIDQHTGVVTKKFDTGYSITGLACAPKP